MITQNWERNKMRAGERQKRKKESEKGEGSKMTQMKWAKNNALNSSRRHLGDLYRVDKENTV